jgi:sulfide:quinone oxidoreductase
MPGKTIVVAGAGIGGIVFANRLREKLAPAHRIIVVERGETHAFAASFLWLMVGQRQRNDITRKVRDLLASGVELVIGTVEEVDPRQKFVRVGSDVIAYDTLVLATGAEMKLDPPAAETFFTLDGAEHLHNVLRDFRGGKVAVLITSTPYKCPGAPAEGAMLIRDFLRDRGVAAQVDLYTPEPAPMPVAGPPLGEAVKGMLSERGVGYHPKHTYRGVDDSGVQFENRDAVRADLIVAVPRHLPPAVLRTAGVANDAGWAAVDPRTLATSDPSIFALGDSASVPLPGRWDPKTPLMLPKAGVFAHAQALALAGRIAASIHGEANAPEFCGDGFCMLEAGEGLAGFAYGDFFATPSPELHLKNVGKMWHASKVLFEQWWLAGPGIRKSALGLAIRAGGKAMGIAVEL